MTPAELLLAAADLLEKRAGEATPGPWTPHYASDLHTDTAAWIGAPGRATKDGVFIATTANAVEGLGDATYIATMHPEAGKRQAAILRAFGVAVEREWRGFHEMWKTEQRVRMLNDRMPGLVEALDLADLLLAGAS